MRAFADNADVHASADFSASAVVISVPFLPNARTCLLHGPQPVNCNGCCAGFVGFKTDMHASSHFNASGGKSSILSFIQAGMVEIDTRWTFPFRGSFFRHFWPVSTACSNWRHNSPFCTPTCNDGLSDQLLLISVVCSD